MIFKFKAKSIEYDEFVYGSLIIRSGVLSDVYSILEQSVSIFDKDIILDNETIIDRDTICYYIGIEDKWGRFIYSNDYIVHNNETYLIKYDEELFSYTVISINKLDKIRSLKWLKNVNKYIKIIGNKFD